VTPYYEDDDVTLYLGDCREITAWLEADVLVTDPPYGMEYVARYDHYRRAGVVGDESTVLRDEVLALWGDRPALVFGSWRNPRPACDQLLIWDKGAEAALGHPRWWSAHEEIYVRGRGWLGRREPNVLRVNGLTRSGRLRDSLDHPTPKPVTLMERLITACPPGVIADPFVGSGATLLAARAQGRRSIGVEIEERYCELIARRLAQGDLFGGVA
jgi:hypothetical protein